MKEEIARTLLQANAVSIRVDEPYTFSSGIKSPIYCDNRILISNPEKREAIIGGYLEALQGLSFDVIAGVSSAGVPWAAFLADRLNKPMVYVRKKAKEHGKVNQIEGTIKPGQQVVVIEDLVSSGGSSLNAVIAVREAGGIVDHCVAIVTYEMETAKSAFSEGACILKTLTDFSTLMNVAEEDHSISSEEKVLALEWNKNPQEWNAAVNN